jgi:tetratricopeptide (TPR) repeat protein
VTLCLAAGLTAKPMLVTFPLTLLILDFWPLGRFSSGGGTAPGRQGPRRALHLLAEKIPLLVLVAVSAFLTYQAQFAGGSVKQGGAFSFPARLANAVAAPAFYLGKLCAPVGLSVFYPHPLRVDAVRTAGAALLLVVLTGIAARQATRRPWLLAGWSWFLVTLAPVLGLVQVGLQAAADRYTYVPLLGIFVAVAWTAADLVRGHRRRSMAAGALVVVVLCVCAALTRGQLAVWQDTFSLFEQALRVDPGNWLAHNSYGAALVAAGRSPEAIPHYAEAIRLNPGYSLPQNNLAVVLMQRGSLPEAIARLREAIRLDPGYVDAWYNLGNAHLRSGRADLAAEAFRGAIARNPDHVEARNNLARALIADNRLDEALAQLRAAERIDPGFVYTLFNLGDVLQRQGQLTPAAAYIRKVVELDPNFPGAARALEILEGPGRR